MSCRCVTCHASTGHYIPRGPSWVRGHPDDYGVTVCCLTYLTRVVVAERFPVRAANRLDEEPLTNYPPHPPQGGGWGGGRRLGLSEALRRTRLTYRLFGGFERATYPDPFQALSPHAAASERTRDNHRSRKSFPKPLRKRKAYASDAISYLQMLSASQAG